jgi:hypothetical protein
MERRRLITISLWAAMAVLFGGIIIGLVIYFSLQEQPGSGGDKNVDDNKG